MTTYQPHNLITFAVGLLSAMRAQVADDALWLLSSQVLDDMRAQGAIDVTSDGAMDAARKWTADAIAAGRAEAAARRTARAEARAEAAPDYHAPHELEARRVAAEARAELRATRYNYEATEQRSKNAVYLITAAMDLARQMPDRAGVVRIAALKETAALADPDFAEAMAAHLDAGHLVPIYGGPLGAYFFLWRDRYISEVRINV